MESMEDGLRKEEDSRVGFHIPHVLFKPILRDYGHSASRD
jgi:hypothetical protein